MITREVQRVEATRVVASIRDESGKDEQTQRRMLNEENRDRTDAATDLYKQWSTDDRIQKTRLCELRK